MSKGVYERKSFSDEHKRNIGKANIGEKYPKEKYPDFGNRNKSTWLKGLTKETDERVAKIAESAIKTWNIPETKAKASKSALKKFEDPEERKKLSKIMAIVMNKPEVKERHKKAMIIAMKNNWQDSEYKEKQIKAIFKGRNRKPNKLEQFFNKITLSIIRYVGNGQFFIVTKNKTHNPDFKISNQRKIIELWGNYWHKGEDIKELIKEYAEVNWECKIFWESEVYNDTERVLEDTMKFIEY